MTADQFHALTRLKMDLVWPGRSGRAKMEVTMTIDQLQTIVATLQTRHRMDIEAIREGEGAEAAHTEEKVVGSKELTIPKLDQVVQVEGGNPDDKGKGEEETLSENSDTEEEEEINQVIQDQVEGGNPDNNGKREKETSSKNSDTEEEEEINQVIRDQVRVIGDKNQ